MVSVAVRAVVLKDYWQGRDRVYAGQLSKEIRDNATELLRRVNGLMSEFGEHRMVTSGWRPPQVNAAIPNAAKRSNHMTGRAVDLEDIDGDLDEWCLDHEELLAKWGLWLEHPSATKGWTHLQCIPPKSGKRVFYP